MDKLYRDKNGNIYSVSPIQQPQDGLIELTKKEIEEHLNQIIQGPIEEIEDERIALIKSKASELILARYSITWQLNHPRVDETYINQYAWIDNIRRISNEAESNGTALEDIVWEILNG